MVSYAAESSLLFRFALKRKVLAVLFVTGDSNFQTADVMMLSTLDWKLNLVASCLEHLRVLVGR